DSGVLCLVLESGPDEGKSSLVRVVAQVQTTHLLPDVSHRRAMMKFVRLRFPAWLAAALVLRSLPLAAATFLVTDPGDSGPGTLRQAILDANAAPDEDRIEFQLAGTAPYSIQVLSQLPDVQGPAVMDGFTQPGFTGRPLIELRGD